MYVLLCIRHNMEKGSPKKWGQKYYVFVYAYISDHEQQTGYTLIIMWTKKTVYERERGRDIEMRIRKNKSEWVKKYANELGSSWLLDASFFHVLWKEEEGKTLFLFWMKSTAKHNTCGCGRERFFIISSLFFFFLFPHSTQPFLSSWNFLFFLFLSLNKIQTFLYYSISCHVESTSSSHTYIYLYTYMKVDHISYNTAHSDDSRKKFFRDFSHFFMLFHSCTFLYYEP